MTFLNFLLHVVIGKLPSFFTSILELGEPFRINRADLRRLGALLLGNPACRIFGTVPQSNDAERTVVS